MTTSNEALQSLCAQVDTKVDVVVGGAPALARRLVTAAAAVLAERAQVVAVAAHSGELSLSALIAQVSGRPDFDEQDDAVLELGFKRLSEGGRPTVLLLQAPRGVSRSALRYVQHVSRRTPGLVLVVLASPALDAMLNEAAFAPLSARLRAAPPIEVGEVEPLPVMAPVLAVAPFAAQAAPAPRRRGRAWLWTAPAGIAAACAAVAWFGQGAIVAGPATSRNLHLTMPAEPAVAASAPLANAMPPATTPIATAAANAVAAPTVVRPAPAPTPLGWSAPNLLPPPSLAVAPHIATASLPLPPLVKPEHAALSRRIEPRREPARVARAPQEWAPPPGWESAQARYAWEPPPAPASTPWTARRELRRGETPYLGTYAVDPYGMRVFQYDP